MSLRSRIRGGQDYLTARVATAAQFLTLRLIPIGSTHMGCDDSDGPRHAPRYLDVRQNSMLEIILLIMLCGVFWKYGKEMGVGKWIMIAVFIGCWLGISVVFPVPILPLIGSAVITSILGICLSVMRDQQKKTAVEQKIESANAPRNCIKCGKPYDLNQVRCFHCGTSLIRK